MGGVDWGVLGGWCRGAWVGAGRGGGGWDGVDGWVHGEGVVDGIMEAQECTAGFWARDWLMEGGWMGWWVNGVGDGGCRLRDVKLCIYWIHWERMESGTYQLLAIFVGL